MESNLVDVIKNIREFAALPSSGLTGIRKHLVEWADKLELVQAEQEVQKDEANKALSNVFALVEEHQSEMVLSLARTRIAVNNMRRIKEQSEVAPVAKEEGSEEEEISTKD